MTGKRESQWRLDLQSVLHETNQLTISASENSINAQIANIPKKYKKKKVHDDRKRSVNHPEEILDLSKKPQIPAVQKPSRPKEVESDGEDRNTVVRKRKTRQKKMHIGKDATAPATERCPQLDSRASSETDAESYQADAEMGGNQEDSDYDPVFDHVVDIEMYADSTSSIFDDSSHSESNNKDEGCEGDDELTDVEGGSKAHQAHHLVIRSRLNATGSMPSRQMDQISAIMENSSWSHIKANKLPGLVARSIRNRIGNRRRPKVKTIQSIDDNQDKYDFSSIDLPVVKFKNVNLQNKRKTSESTDKFGESSKKISRDSF